MQAPGGISFEIGDIEALRAVTGSRGELLRYLEKKLAVSLSHRGSKIRIGGDPRHARLAGDVLKEMVALASRERPVSFADIDTIIRALAPGDVTPEELFDDVICMTPRRKAIVPRSPMQKSYVDAIRRDDIVFSIGPAGTGKTYLAVAMAVAALTRQEVQRIVLTRPAVEAGEKLGFLPGGLAEKVDPYLRPLYDALYEMVDYEKVMRFLEKGVIEIAPIAFMRGRTLNSSFIIMDEAQNTTSEQMKMFLTRMGFGSKVVVTGDITQIDLPRESQSGLIEVQSVLKGVPGIDFVYFTEKDVVRHALVQDIIRSYDIFKKRG